MPRSVPLTLVPLLLAALTPAAAQFAASPELALVDMNGRKETIGVFAETVFAPRVSPDGMRLAIEIISQDEQEPSASIIVAELADLGRRYALPDFEGPVNWAPSWTPDGQRILAITTGADGDTIFWQRADGGGEAERLLTARSAESWAFGGRSLTYLTLAANDDYGISLLDLESGEKRVLIDRPGSAEHSSSVSPNSRFLAYASNATGRFEVYVETLPISGEPVQLTGEGGGHPLWSPDGRTVYFDRDGRLHRIGFDAATGRTADEAEPLPIEGFLQGLYRRQFDLMPDGQRFLLLFPAGSE